jgi:hypothetical protein
VETLPKFEPDPDESPSKDCSQNVPTDENDKIEAASKQSISEVKIDEEKGTQKSSTSNCDDINDGVRLNDEEMAPLFHTPPDNDLDDPDSYVTASNESPKEPERGHDLQQSGVGGSSCKTLNLDQQPEAYSNLKAIFDDSDDGDLPAFELDAEDGSNIDSHDNSDAVKVQDIMNVSLPTTPVENISQKSCHVKPVERTYSLRRRRNFCPKVAIHNVDDDDEDSSVSNWLQNSVLFAAPETAVDSESISSSPSVKSIEPPLKTSEWIDSKDSNRGKEKLVRRHGDFCANPIITRSRLSSSSSIKSVEIPKTPVIKRKSTEDAAKSKRTKSTPVTVPPSDTKSPLTVSKTPRSVNKTPGRTPKATGRTPKTPSSTPRNKRNQKGETLLHRAAIMGDIDKLRLLLVENEIEINSKDNAGWTPLHEACIKRHVECAKLLLKYGALVNAKADNLDTPLHDACSKDAVEIIKLLLDNGACKTLKNIDGCTPVDYAQSDRALQLLDDAKNSKNISVQEDDGCSEDSIMGEFVLAFSGVPNAQFGKYQKMKGLSFKLAEEVTCDVTHLVCALDENKCCKRTIKFLNAMALGVMIVSVEWLEESYKSSNWLNPLEYMVKGAVNSEKYAPCKSFSDHKKGVPRLFTGLTFFIDKRIEASKLGKEAICGLIQSANGKMVSRLPKDTGCRRTKVYHAEENSILHSQSTIIVSENQSSNELLVKSSKWILDCISSYKLFE